MIGQVALLAIFTAHNAEEIAFGTSGAQPDPRVLRRLGLSVIDYRADRLTIATAALTMVVACATTAVDRPRTRTAGYIAIGTASALAANGAGHLLRAAVLRRYNPGAATAPALLAASISVIRAVQQRDDITVGRTALALAAGATASVPAIVASLHGARWLRP
ncbi:HXXEE domain-containing protein [Arthrobacter sp. KNU40]|uniref:HXXEE domain-containing protein n=1 Tax=Arthrobacter sp. KNU40 TaxID=3447965 RepID=UPI003F636C80